MKNEVQNDSDEVTFIDSMTPKTISNILLLPFLIFILVLCTIFLFIYKIHIFVILIFVGIIIILCVFLLSGVVKANKNKNPSPTLYSLIFSKSELKVSIPPQKRFIVKWSEIKRLELHKNDYWRGFKYPVLMIVSKSENWVFPIHFSRMKIPDIIFNLEKFAKELDIEYSTSNQVKDDIKDMPLHSILINRIEEVSNNIIVKKLELNKIKLLIKKIKNENDFEKSELKKVIKEKDLLQQQISLLFQKRRIFNHKLHPWNCQGRSG